MNLRLTDVSVELPKLEESIQIGVRVQARIMMIEYFKCPLCRNLISDNLCSCGWEGSVDLKSVDGILPISSFSEEETIVRSFVGWLINKGIDVDEELINEYLQEI
jgi:hypothetical protein